MRIRHSLKAFVPFIMMLAANKGVQAQQGSPMPPPGVPAGYNMYQRESAYQNLFDQTYQSDGLWMNKSNNGFGAFNRPRDWHMRLDYIKSKTRQMNGIIGADDVQTYYQQMDPANNQIIDGLSFYNYFQAASANMIPDLKTNGVSLTGGFWNTDGSGLMLNGFFSANNTSTFDARKNALAARPVDALTALRLRRNGGIDDGTPFNTGGRNDLDLVENDILAPGTAFDATDAIGHGFYGSTFDILDRTVLNLFGMPVYSGNTPIVQTGETMPYDLQFILEHSVQTFGGTADWAFTPVYERGNLTVRPIFGGRYLQINEGFRFYGASTLLSYGLDNADADTPINGKVFPPGDGIDDDNDFIPDTPDEPSDTINTTGTTFTAPTGPTGPLNNLIVRSHLNSSVISNLAGPEAGLQYDLGDAKGMKITGSTRLGAMFNKEQLKLRGDNIGNALGTEVIPDLNGNNISIRMFDTDTQNGPSQNAFSSADHSTHLSPLFEQGLNLNIPLFARVPVIKDMWQFEDAALNLGWSYLWVGQVADPNDSIIYQSSPLTGIFPKISPDRNNFTQTTLSVGVSWSY